MLVLSRRPSETITFPQLGIAVSVVSVNGSRVRLGIDAPPEIKVVRKELHLDSGLCQPGCTKPPTESIAAGLSKTALHEFRNRLNKATLGLYLAQKQLAAGRHSTAERTLQIALDRLAELDSASKSHTFSSDESCEQISLSSGAPRQQSRSASDQLERQSIDVLLVEDDQNEQALLRCLLELEGYHVRTANNGIEALACLQEFKPRFVLLDMMMPECNGTETLLRIRQEPELKHMPVFAVSGSPPQSMGVEIGGGGVDDWFPKPLDAQRLVHFMRERVAALSA